MMYCAAGALLALSIVCIDYRFLVSLAPLVYAAALIALIAILTVGLTFRGGKSWFRVFGFGIQPSEFTKLAVIFMLAWYLAKIGTRVRKLFYFGLAFVIAGVPSVLIAAQSDLGTAITYVPVVFVMLFAAGCKRWHLIALIVIGALAVPVGWTQLKPYQKARVQTFFNPTETKETRQGEGYHIIQTKIAVGSGQMWGKGVGHGTQTQLGYLPEYRTDFIFSHLAEERGFVGAVTVGASSRLSSARVGPGRELWRPRRQAARGGVRHHTGLSRLCEHRHHRTLAPHYGLPLPFLSYGGSFYLTTMMCVGTMLSVHVRKGMFDT